MALAKLIDVYPDYKERIFGGIDIKGFDVYTMKDEKVGEVHDALIDEAGRFRYLVIDTGFWIFGKKVLLPVGRARMNYDRRRVYVEGMTKAQAESLPEYTDTMTVDYNYEERVRNVYRSTGTAAATATTPTYSRESYTYEQEPDLFEVNEANNKVLKLYEERLLADKERYKAGEVAVGKRVETETAQVSVPIEKERVIIERKGPGAAREVRPGDVDFHEGEVARMEVHEEAADIEKKAYVREEVGIKKEVEQSEVRDQAQIRREELEVDVDGNPVIRKEKR